MRLYDDLTSWWPLLSAPEDYEEEAEFYARQLREHCATPPRTLLELGSGGGNNAFHMKREFELTLVDKSPGMVDVSRRLNPECEHAVGDMRTVRLGTPVRLRVRARRDRLHDDRSGPAAGH